jgi:hypothetical protein
MALTLALKKEDTDTSMAGVVWIGGGIAGAFVGSLVGLGIGQARR